MVNIEIKIKMSAGKEVTITADEAKELYLALESCLAIRPKAKDDIRIAGNIKSFTSTGVEVG